MNRFTTIATLAAGAAFALSPALAFADDSAGASVSSDANVHAGLDAQRKPSLFGAIGARLYGSASTSMDDRDRKDHAGQMPGDKGDRSLGHMAAMSARGQQAVEVRIDTLQKLEARIDAMARLTSDEKDALKAQIAAQIDALASLKAQISSDASSTTLAADLKTIRPDYRTFLLTMPRAAILAASDRVMTIAAQMGTVGDKLQARISDEKAAGTDVSAQETAYADFQAKVADAKVQAQAASDLVADLKADNGDQTALLTNLSALKSARAKLQTAHADLVAARKDMAAIIGGVKGKGMHGEASSTVEVK